MFLSTLLDMELVQALNPLYAFPIVAVILCAFIVYAFGFKSPVQPPSFDGIEEKKPIKKRKTKEVNKGKVIQNGKMNGSTLNKVASSVKKRDVEKATNDKPVIEKSNAEKKVTKKSKPSNEKKVVVEKKEKKKESFSQDENGEDGWVQLVSKKGRKSRKKGEVEITESPKMTKPAKITVEKTVASDENTPSDDLLVNQDNLSDILKESIPEKKLAVKKKEDIEAKNLENEKDKIAIIAEESVVNEEAEKVPLKDITMNNGKLNEETSNKSKKKKKRNSEVINADNDSMVAPKPPAVQVISEVIPTPNAFNVTPVITETSEIIAANLEENKPKEMKSSNVAFDELAGLYPQEKEQKKKKRVRRDH